MAAREPRVGRPIMELSYGITQEPTAEQIPWVDVVARLTAARNYWTCTTRPDGRPHAMPVWGLWLDDRFIFATGAASIKGRNLAANPALSVHLESGDDVIIFEGVAALETDPDRLARFLDAYEAKYAFRPDPTNPNDVVWALQPRVVLAWFEKNFPKSATRYIFDDDAPARA